MDLPRDEIAFRKTYESLVLSKKLTVVFRPGNRIYPNRRGYKLGEIVTLRIIEKCGSDKDHIPPVFNDIKIKIKIKNIVIINIEDLKTDDFQGSSSDVVDVITLKKHLSYIYQQPITNYDKQLVTKIEIQYMDEIS